MSGEIQLMNKDSNSIEANLVQDRVNRNLFLLELLSRFSVSSFPLVFTFNNGEELLNAVCGGNSCFSHVYAINSINSLSNKYPTSEP